jgi:hypothetical protein
MMTLVALIHGCFFSNWKAPPRTRKKRRLVERWVKVCGFAGESAKNIIQWHTKSPDKKMNSLKQDIDSERRYGKQEYETQ